MSKFKKIIKEGISNLLETKGFEEFEVAFGVKHKSDNLSDVEKNQFGPMGQLKTSEGGSFPNPKVTGTKEVDKANLQGGKDAQSYYKEVVNKIKNFQTPNDGNKIEGPRVPTNTGDNNERIETTGYDNGISGMEVTADLATEKGGSEQTKKVYKDRVEKLQGDKSNFDKFKKKAKETNDLKYKKDAQNTRPVKAQTSNQPKNENTFKVNGKLVSEEQVLKLSTKLPSRIKMDETKFEITDGENTYKLIWEGDNETGEAVITNYKNNQLVNEDVEKMKHLWGFKSDTSISTKKNITESGDDAFRRMFKSVKGDNKKF